MKKWASIFLCCSLVIGFVGCGDEKPKDVYDVTEEDVEEVVAELEEEYQKSLEEPTETEETELSFTEYEPLDEIKNASLESGNIQFFDTVYPYIYVITVDEAVAKILANASTTLYTDYNSDKIVPAGAEGYLYFSTSEDVDSNHDYYLSYTNSADETCALKDCEMKSFSYNYGYGEDDKVFYYPGGYRKDGYGVSVYTDFVENLKVQGYEYSEKAADDEITVFFAVPDAVCENGCTGECTYWAAFNANDGSCTRFGLWSWYTYPMINGIPVK